VNSSSITLTLLCNNDTVQSHEGGELLNPTSQSRWQLIPTNVLEETNVQVTAHSTDKARLLLLLISMF
jgi:hypothetical protein